MATKDKETKALAKPLSVVLGRVADDAAMADFIGEGFAQIETVIFGEGDGKIGRYVGQLIGHGAPIERADQGTGEVSAQKTFAFHPMTRTEDGTIGAVENVTHVIPASYMMAAACDRILEEAQKRGKTAIVGLIYRGQVPTRRGFRVNDIGVFEKYV